MILVQKHLPLSQVEIKRDNAGRYVMIKGVLYGEQVSYLNVYAPPDSGTSLFTHVFSLFSNWLYASSVIAGDFNCCIVPRLDKSHVVASNLDKSFEIL